MLRVLTASGSIYEIDQYESKIRRVSGSTPGTQRVGQDGEWRTFMDMVIGETLFIVWRQNPETLVLETTVTSPIERVWEESLLA